MDDKQHFHVPISQESISAIEALEQASSLSRAELKQCFAKGAVWWQAKARSHPSHSSTKTHRKAQRLRRIKKVLSEGDMVDLYYHPKLLNKPVPEATLICDRQEYSIWFKPRGMLSQGSKWGDHTALYRWVEMNFHPETGPRQAWMVHRLDRATAGLQIIAHSAKMAANLSKMFVEHQIHKSYQAWVHGCFPTTTQTFTTPLDNKSAITHARALQLKNQPPHLSRVEIEIETGRKHQIRQHLSMQDFPIVGDRLYGNLEADEQLGMTRPDLQLTAFRLQFDCPITQQPLDIQLSPEQMDLIS